MLNCYTLFTLLSTLLYNTCIIIDRRRARTNSVRVGLNVTDRQTDRQTTRSKSRTVINDLQCDVAAFVS